MHQFQLRLDILHSPNVGSQFMKFHRYTLKLFYLKQVKCLLYFLLSHIPSLSIFNTIRFDHNSCKFIFYLNYSICLECGIPSHFKQKRIDCDKFISKINLILSIEKDKCPYELPYDISVGPKSLLQYARHRSMDPVQIAVVKS